MCFQEFNLLVSPVNITTIKSLQSSMAVTVRIYSDLLLTVNILGMQILNNFLNRHSITEQHMASSVYAQYIV